MAPSRPTLEARLRSLGDNHAGPKHSELQQRLANTTSAGSARRPAETTEYTLVNGCAGHVHAAAVPPLPFMIKIKRGRAAKFCFLRSRTLPFAAPAAPFQLTLTGAGPVEQQIL